MRYIGSIGVLALVCGMACSAAPAEDGSSKGPGAETQAGGGRAKNEANSTSSNPDAPKSGEGAAAASGGGVKVADCSAAKYDQTCFACCSDAYPALLKKDKSAQDTLDACSCKACATECNGDTVCGGTGDKGDTCLDCINSQNGNKKAAACQDAWRAQEKELEKDPEYIAREQCQKPCEDKPEEPEDE